jgi:CDP-glycerol glycerophosphotransferase
LSGKNDSKMADLFVSNSISCTNMYKKYFWYNGDILEYGCPRNDIIVNNDRNSIEKVKKYF